MSDLYRTTLSACCLALILPYTSAAMAADAPAAPAPATTERQPLLERSQEDAAALGRQLPASEQQTLQAGSDDFLSLWLPANGDNPAGTVVIVPGAGESADWPEAIGPLRRKLPDAGWNTLSLTLPDLASQTPTARPEEKPAPVQAGSSSTPPDAGASVEKATAPGSENVDAPSSEAADTQQEQDAERVFARIEAAIAFAQQQRSRSIVLLGHGTGAYWATRYLQERRPPHVQRLVMVAAKTPSDAQTSFESMNAELKLSTADFYYTDRQVARDAAQRRLQASKRIKGNPYSQVGLNALPADRNTEQEQLFRRVRGWLSPQDLDKPSF